MGDEDGYVGSRAGRRVVHGPAAILLLATCSNRIWTRIIAPRVGSSRRSCCCCCWLLLWAGWTTSASRDALRRMSACSVAAHGLAVLTQPPSAAGSFASPINLLRFGGTLAAPSGRGGGVRSSDPAPHRVCFKAASAPTHRRYRPFRTGTTYRPSDGRSKRGAVRHADKVRRLLRHGHYPSIQGHVTMENERRCTRICGVCWRNASTAVGGVMRSMLRDPHRPRGSRG